MKRAIFSATNRQAPECGDPPGWLTDEADGKERRSYFENAHGEQWIAAATVERFRLTSGHVGWKTIEVKKPRYDGLVSELTSGDAHGMPAFRGVVLDAPEIVWLTSVFMAAMYAHESKGEPKDLRGRRLQVKVTLQGVKPPIWRRLIVPAELTLEELSLVFQVAMGWENAHLHGFVIGGVRYGMADVDGMDDREKDEREYRLGDVAQVKDRFAYEYDFGDGWMHQVIIEKELEGTEGAPLACLDGRRACPPEDCGGAWGYEELLEILADPKHPDHAERREWTGGLIDPEAFDASEVSKRLAAMLEPPRKARRGTPRKTKKRPAHGPRA